MENTEQTEQTETETETKRKSFDTSALWLIRYNYQGRDGTEEAFQYCNLNNDSHSLTSGVADCLGFLAFLKAKQDGGSGARMISAQYIGEVIS